ncbi:hypothetical protein J4E93_001530 [Alternaria ventricosa]|uniref:uncharacterized protein n=1 Tax=Alternaria ventricosa TaxID=1187951 RepID=UPI0020C4C345|nr:uncharacterized protein J4E93_001530 [Alternaria ventricosa]KAI4653763.1 hypothetical protein J4E93_001530 [Alternaria ventricosa]
MALRLSAWLEETFESQLLLGNQWLQDTFERKRSGVKAQLHRQWDVYHDNGSSLDIINYVHSDRNSALLLYQVAPLTLTDGQVQILSQFTPNCARNFHQEIPALSHLSIGTTVAVRTFTIRLTSYGPSRERLRLILDRIDWLGDNRERVQNLRRETVDDAMADNMGSDGNMPHGNELQSQMMGTQLPFGTQLPLPSRPHAGNEELQVIGVNRLEPVLGGNTQRKEIRPGAANTDYEKRQEMQLLGLLGRLPNPNARKPGATSANGFVQSAFGKQQSDATPAVDESLEVPSDASQQHSKNSEPEAGNEEPSPSVSNHERKRVKRVRELSPESAKATENVRNEEQTIEQSLIEDDSETVPPCSWMADLIFNSETLKVPKIQRHCLDRETSWLKPQPGVQPFQAGNMPQSILMACHRMADERAGAETDDESDPDPSAETVDPSPKSLQQKTQDDEPAITKNDRSASTKDDEPETTQDDSDIGSEISWDTSPEPPSRPARAHQELPPDSSIEKPASQSKHDSASQRIPASKQSQNCSVVEISDGDEPTRPPSSPPVLAAPADSDDEMNMEESVPQALGEDLTRHREETSANSKLPKSDPLRSPVVVQVKETPDGKGKNAPGAQSSSGEPKQQSSTSIVHSTYDTPSLSDLAELGVMQSSGDKHKGVEVPSSVPQGPNGDNTGDIEMIDNIPDAQDLNGGTAAAQRSQHRLDQGSKSTSFSHATTKSTHLSPENRGVQSSPAVPHLASQSTKRKLISSPTKSKRRQSKRREIKIVGFGDEAPSAIDPVTALRKERDESLRRWREQRNSSTSFDSRPETTSRFTTEDPDAMEIDGAVKVEKKEPSPSMSPRHQDLYDEPSPRQAKPVANPVPQPPTAHPQLQDRSRDPRPRGPVPITMQPPPVSSNQADQNGAQTVFQSFKATYPQYDGDEKHFRNQCTQMYQLEQEDKMVPKWQWDDFVIRNRTDYRQYAMDCIGQGEDPEPYHRFYKNDIRDTLYKEGIIKNTKTLERALEELSGGPPARPAESRPAVQSAPKPKPVRKSLPGSFNQPKTPTHDRINNAHSPPTTTSTGDKYRDFVFAMQRSASWTGSTEVSPKPKK